MAVTVLIKCVGEYMRSTRACVLHQFAALSAMVTREKVLHYYYYYYYHVQPHGNLDLEHKASTVSYVQPHDFRILSNT